MLLHLTAPGSAWHRVLALILTKLDFLDNCPEIDICTGYIYDGPGFNYGDLEIKKGQWLETAVPYTEVLEYCRPLYYQFEGWLCDTSKAKTYDDLPQKAKVIIDFVKKQTGIIPRLIANGPDREQIIVC